MKESAAEWTEWTAMANNLRLRSEKVPLSNISLRMTDVRKIVERLQVHVDDEGHRVIDEILDNNSSPQQTAEELEQQRKQAFRITVTITGTDGASLFGYGTDPFDSPNIPDPVESVFIGNDAAFRGVAGSSPSQRFSLLLDFSLPSLQQNQNPVAEPTLNESNLKIEGERDAWLASCHDAVMGVLNGKKNSRRFIHLGEAYDALLLILGLPASIYLCYKASALLERFFGDKHAFLEATIYIYIFFLTLNVFRFFFAYTRWAFPSVELIEYEDKTRVHRRFWFAILTSVAAAAIYDLFS